MSGLIWGKAAVVVVVGIRETGKGVASGERGGLGCKGGQGSAQSVRGGERLFRGACRFPGPLRDWGPVRGEDGGWRQRSEWEREKEKNKKMWGAGVMARSVALGFRKGARGDDGGVVGGKKHTRASCWHRRWGATGFRGAATSLPQLRPRLL